MNTTPNSSTQLNHSVSIGHLATIQNQVVSMEDFLRNVDPNEIEIKVVKFDKKYFGQSTYVIEIQLKEYEIFYETNKAITEFQAFYEALNMKFRNLKLTEFPTTSAFKISNSNEKRIQKFQELFDLILSDGQPSEVSPEIQRKLDFTNLHGGLNTSQIQNPKFKLIKPRMRAESMKYEPANLQELIDEQNDNDFAFEEVKEEEGLNTNEFKNRKIQKRNLQRRRSVDVNLTQLEPLVSINDTEDDKFNRSFANGQNNRYQSKRQTRKNTSVDELNDEDNHQIVQVEEDHNLSEHKYKSGQVQLYEKAPEELTQSLPNQNLLISPTEQPQSFQPQQFPREKKQIDKKAQQAKLELKLKEIRDHRESQISRENFDYLFVKLPHKIEWKKYYVRYHNSQLMFCNSVKRHDFKCSYIIYKSMIRKQRVFIGGVDDDSKPRKIDVLMISHKFDDDALLITIPEIFETPELQKIFNPLLDVIQNHLTENTQITPDNMYLIDQTNKNPFGKIMLEIQSIKHFPFYHNIFIRVQCNPFVLTSRKILDSQLDFMQRYYIPVHNHFNTLKIEIINILNDGWFREHVKEQIIATYDIRMTDIDKEPFDENGYIKLPISELIEFKKVGLRPVQDMENQVKKKQAYLQLRVVDMTRLDSMIVFNPNRDIVEDRRKKQGYSFKEISTVMTRTKLIIFLFEWLRDIDRPVLYFDYPRYSWLWFLFLELLAFIFNPYYILTYLTIFVLVLVGSYSDFWAQNISPHLGGLLFREEHLNKLIVPNHQVRTYDQISQEKSKQSLREASNELKQIHQEYNIRDKNILGKFKDFKKSSTVTLNYMDIVCDFFEKSKNLVKWEEPRMTKYFFLLFIVLFIAVTFIPIRIIICIYLVYKFYKGQFYHRKRIRNNREIIKIEFLNFIEENKLKNQMGDITKFDESWEKLLGKAMNIKIFEQKLSVYFQETLKLYFPKDILKLRDPKDPQILLADSPNKLIDYVSKVKDRLNLPLRDRNEIHFECNPNIYRSAIPSYIYLLNFLMNRVPSDIYRIKNPRLEIGQEDRGVDGRERVFTVKQEVRTDLRGVLPEDESQLENNEKMPSSLATSIAGNFINKIVN
eukprot:403335495